MSFKRIFFKRIATKVKQPAYTKFGKAPKSLFKQYGAAISEFVVTVPALLLLGLGGIQAGLVYNAKNTVTYATFEAARKGAVNNALTGPMREELGIRIAPIFGGDGTPEKAAEAMALGVLEAKDPRYTRIVILNPTEEAFDDFGELNADGKLELPNNHLRFRDREIGSTSDVNIQDANLLKIKVTYGYSLKVPLIKNVILAAMRVADPENAHYYVLGRIPVSSVATVRMQSPAFFSDAVVSKTGGGGAIPPVDPDTGTEDPTEEPTEGEGGDIADTPSEDATEYEELADTDGYTSEGEVGGAEDFSCHGLGFCTEPDDPFSPISYLGDGASCAAASSSEPSTSFAPSIALSTPATSKSLALPALVTGNPISIVTGNKFQRETDIARLPNTEGIVFERFYNSLGSKAKTELGYGWRHTFMLSLKQIDQTIAIQQADARGVFFTQTEKPMVYAAQVHTDGQIEVTNNNAYKYVWMHKDGSKLSFNDKGQFVQLQSRTGGRLKLTYNVQNQLVQVKDELARTLNFEYYPNGRLKNVIDPTGKLIRYRYSAIGNLAKVTNREGKERKYRYENSRHKHHLTGVVDERGVRFATWGYDDQGRAVLSEHAGGVERVQLEFKPNETIATDSFGRKTHYKTELRNGIPLVTEVRGPGCDACGVSDVSYQYNSQYQVTSIKHHKEKIEQRYKYDDLGRVTESLKIFTSTDQVLDSTYYSYSESSTFPDQIIRPSVNPEGKHVTQFEYNHAQQPIRVTESGWQPDTITGNRYSKIQRTTQYQYSSKGQITSVLGPRVDVEDNWVFEYNSLGQLKRLTSPDGQSQVIHQYDEYGRPSSIEQSGLITNVVYNLDGKISTLTRNGLVTKLHYSPTGQLLALTLPTGKRLTYEYDQADRLQSVSDLRGNKRSWVYNSASQKIGQQYAAFDGGIATSIEYMLDVAGHLKNIENNNLSASIEHSKTQSKTVLTGQNGNTLELKYNPLGQLLQLTQAGIATTEYNYNPKQQLTELIDTRGIKTQYAYNDFNQLIAVKSPESGLQQYRYDAVGNAVSYTNAEGQTRVYEYTAANKLALAVLPEGEVQFNYNQHGRLASVVNTNESASYTYHPNGQLKSHTRSIEGNDYATYYTYNKLGQLIEKRLPSGAVLRYRYHTDGPLIGQLQEITKKSLWRDELVYGDINSLVNSSTQFSVTFSNGIKQTTKKDARGNIKSIEHDDVLGLNYEYTDSEKVKTISWKTKTEQGSEKYEYSPFGQLIKVEDADKMDTYNYDIAGNRVRKKTELKKNVSEKRLTEAQQLAQIGKADKEQWLLYDKTSNRQIGQIEESDQLVTKAWQYNESGSPIKTFVGDNEYRYEYNSEQRPVKVFKNGRFIASYKYNAFGERIQKTTLSPVGKKEVTYYLYEDHQIIAEANASGTITKSYVYYQKKPVALVQDNNLFAIHTDRMGAPRAITDKNKRIVWAAHYDAFGKADTNTDPDNDGEHFAFNLRFPGQYEDAETGTYYNYLRDYNPTTGRYLTSDPLGKLGGVNTYLYANANPVGYIDPLGLAPIDDSLTDAERAELDSLVAPGVALDSSYIYAYHSEAELSCSRDAPPASIAEAKQQAFISVVDSFTTKAESSVVTIHGETLQMVLAIQKDREAYVDYIVDYRGSLATGTSKYYRDIEMVVPVKYNWLESKVGGTGTFDMRERDRGMKRPGQIPLDEFTRGLNSIHASSADIAGPTAKDVDANGQVLVVNKDASLSDIRNEIIGSLGAFAGIPDAFKEGKSSSEIAELERLAPANSKLVAHIDRTISLAQAKRDESVGDELIINLAPLYRETYELFYDTLYSAESVQTAYDNYLIAQENYEYRIAECGKYIYSPSYSPISPITTCYMTAGAMKNAAKKRYQNAIEDEKERLIKLNYLPRHDTDQYWEDEEFAMAMLAFDIATLFTPVQWISLASKGIKGAMAATTRLLASSAAAGIKLGLKGLAAREAFERSFTKFIWSRAKKIQKETNEWIASKGFGDLAGKLTDEFKANIRVSGYSDDVLTKFKSDLAVNPKLLDLVNSKPENLAKWKLIDKISATTCSFDGATLVLTEGGYKPISQITVGQDKVWAKEEATGSEGYKPVLARYANNYQYRVTLTIRDGETGVEQQLVSNKIHPFFAVLPYEHSQYVGSEGHVYSGNISNGAWVDASELKAGYRLLNDDGSWAEVVTVNVTREPLVAYNLTVAEFNTYFVSANSRAGAVWVHNTCTSKLINRTPSLTEKVMDDLGDDAFKALISRNSGMLDNWAIASTIDNPALRRNPAFLESLGKLAAKKGADDSVANITGLLDSGLAKTLSKMSEADAVAMVKKMEDWPIKNLDELASRLANTSYKGLADELASPTMFNLYDEIIKSPENAWDFAKRGGQGVIDKVGASSFFKHITGAGRAFEQKILRDVFNPSSAAYKQLQKVVPDLADRKIISNVKICLNPKAVTCTEKGSYFIADQVLVKYGKDEFGKKIIADMVVAEIKLSAKTATTKGQTTAAKSIGSKLTLRTSKRTEDADGKFMEISVNPGEAFTLSRFVKVFGDGAGNFSGANVYNP